jgi:hypothetical protein
LEISGMRSRVPFGLVLAWIPAAVLAASGRVPAARAEADTLNQKLVQIATNGLAAKPAARRTPVSELELNTFLKLHADLPEGVIDPTISILPDGRLSGRAIVDLEALAKSPDAGALGAAAALGGQVPVEAVGTLRTQNGVGAFTIESATVNGVTVPKALLLQIVAHYSRTEEQPQGVDLEAPFRLPAKIREIQTTRGQAFIVQ